MAEIRSTGLQVRPPDKSCNDRNCPFHGGLRIRGKLLSGRAVSVAARYMAVIERESYKYNAKYGRYLKRRSKIHAHLPPCIDVRPGQIVAVAECRPLAKSVSFVVVETNIRSGIESAT